MDLAIERLPLAELRAYLQEQTLDSFPELKDGQRLDLLSAKWHSFADFCTSRNEEGQLVGMIAFYANRPEEGVVYIPHVYVSPNYRGKRLMASMLQVIEAFAKGKGFKIIQLEVNKNNKRAQRAYLRYGFSFMDHSTEESFFMQSLIL